MNMHIVPPGKFKTINMCNYCERNPDTCGATRSFGEILRYVPGILHFERNLYKNSRKNVIVCDKFKDGIFG